MGRFVIILSLLTMFSMSSNAQENTCKYHTEAITENGVVTKYVEKKKTTAISIIKSHHARWLLKKTDNF